jgi:hypothetical protein
MAKRRKNTVKRRSHKRRKGMGALPGMSNITGSLINVAGAIGGAVAASYVENKLLEKMFVDKPAIKSGLVMAGGILLESMMKQSILKSVGNGMAIAGGLSLAKTLVPGLKGIGEYEMTSLMEDITIGEEVAMDEDITIGDTIAEDVTIGDLSDDMSM